MSKKRIVTAIMIMILSVSLYCNEFVEGEVTFKTVIPFEQIEIVESVVQTEQEWFNQISNLYSISSLELIIENSPEFNNLYIACFNDSIDVSNIVSSLEDKTGDVEYAGPNYIARFNRFDCNLNYMDSMLDISSGLGDKGFIIDGNSIIRFGGSGITIIKETYNPVSVEDDLICFYPECLLSNYPNPFNPSTTISYELNKKGMVGIQIYNLKGQKIRTILREYNQIGNYKIHWNGIDEKGHNVSSGVYFIRMSIDKELVNTHKMLMIK